MLHELNVLQNTLNLIHDLPESVAIISTTIVFSELYEELEDPVGILKSIKELGAFKRNTFDAEEVPEFQSIGERIVRMEGKHGLNAFINTDLETYLRTNNIEKIMLAGCVCSICIDSTGRSAYDKGFEVYMLSDCITGRTMFEQNFYCNEVFPLYSEVITSKELLHERLP